MDTTATRAACPEHSTGLLFRNESTGHLHCTIGGTECVSFSDLVEPYTIGSDGYVYAAADTAPHFHAGQNLPGYLPESDVACFSTFDEAKRYIIGNMLQQADDVATWSEPHGCDDVPCPAYGDDCPENKAADLTSTAEDLNLSNGPEWQSYAGDLSYWINLVPAEDCDSDADA